MTAVVAPLRFRNLSDDIVRAISNKVSPKTSLYEFVNHLDQIFANHASRNYVLKVFTSVADEDVPNLSRTLWNGERFFDSDTLYLSNSASVPSKFSSRLLESILNPLDKRISIHTHPSSPFTEVTDNPSATLFVQTLTGKRIEISLPLSALAVELKERIQVKEGIPVDQSRLIFGGVQLEDSVPLSFYKIRSGSSIHLVLRLRGGMFALSSGRHDYCSSIPPNDGAMGGPIVFPKEIHVDYQDGNMLKSLALYVHPLCPPERIKEMVRMETDRNYFAGLSNAKLREIYIQDKERLSREAFLELARAVVGQMSEGNFFGRGHTLKADSSASVEQVEAKKIVVDNGKPQTQLTIKFTDEKLSSIAQKFNTSHTIGDVKGFIQDTCPMDDPFSIGTSFQNYNDNSVTLEEAGLFDCVVFVRKS